MYSRTLTKPDGRLLTLYSRAPIEEGIVAPSPSRDPVKANPHLRWHPLRGEWVSYAAYRQDRTFLPPPEFNPLAPTTDPASPTELPQGRYDVAVFENRFPTLSPTAHDPPSSIVPTAPANGACEVVVFTRDPKAWFSTLAVDHIELLLEVWADRTRALSALSQIKYVMPFENKGAEVGVTLHHPHGQIYAYPFVPPVPGRMLEQELIFWQREGKPLLETLIGLEIEDGRRILYQDGETVAFVPAWARYPYEVWVAPIRRVESLGALSPNQRLGMARALKTVTMKFDGLWQRPFPYLMVWYQAPTDGQSHPETHLHAEFYPPYRTRDKLKYLAGTELGAGMFASDALPEDKARELQAVTVSLES